MGVEFRDWNGMQMTFWVGMDRPVWWLAEVARQTRDVPRAARRCGLRVSQLRAVLEYVHCHARRVEYERQLALDAGFDLPRAKEPKMDLVFPAEQLRWRRTEVPVPPEDSRGWSRRERFHRMGS